MCFVFNLIRFDGSFILSFLILFSQTKQPNFTRTKETWIRCGNKMSTYQRWLQHNKSIQTIFDFDVRNLESLETGNLEDVSSNESSTEDLFYANELESSSLAFLIILYATMILGGVLGNASLILSLCSSASVRLRNPLLLSLCFADISVAIFSATSTITTAVLIRQTQWKLSTTLCKILNFLEVSFSITFCDSILIKNNKFIGGIQIGGWTFCKCEISIPIKKGFCYIFHLLWSEVNPR